MALMPITSSAKKALRASAHKRTFNVRRKNAISATVKTVKKFVSENNTVEAHKALSLAYKALDKAAKTHYITSNTADRKKSRLAALVKKIAAK